MTPESIRATLQWVSITFGAIAAVFWLLSAMVPMPKGRFSVTTFDLGGIAVGSSQQGIKLLEALARQSTLSAIGAVAASVSATAQVLQVKFFG